MRLIISVLIACCLVVQIGCSEFREFIVDAATTYPALKIHHKRSLDGTPFEGVHERTEDPVNEYISDANGNSTIFAGDQQKSIGVFTKWPTAVPIQERTRLYVYGLEKGTRQITMVLNNNPYDPNYKLGVGQIVQEDGAINFDGTLHVPFDAKDVINVDDDIDTIIEYVADTTQSK